MAWSPNLPLVASMMRLRLSCLIDMVDLAVWISTFECLPGGTQQFGRPFVTSDPTGVVWGRLWSLSRPKGGGGGGGPWSLVYAVFEV